MLAMPTQLIAGERDGRKRKEVLAGGMFRGERRRRKDEEEEDEGGSRSRELEGPPRSAKAKGVM